MWPELASEGVLKSAYKPETRLDLVDPEDVGKVALKIFEEPERWNGRAFDVLAQLTTVEETVRLLGEVSEKSLKLEISGEDEPVGEGFRAGVLDSQRLMVKLDETGRFEPELEGLRELGVVLTDWREFLERKREDGVLQESIGGKEVK